MKKLIAIAFLMILGIFSASAQTRIGFIETDALIGAMPESIKIDAEIKEYQASLGQQGHGGRILDE